LTFYRQHTGNRSALGFFEDMDALHAMWWNDRTLSARDRARVRRALLFDRRLSAHHVGEASRRAFASRRFKEGGTLLLHTVKRYVDAILLAVRLHAASIVAHRSGPGAR
jgi:hypothetical protein